MNSWLFLKLIIQSSLNRIDCLYRMRIVLIYFFFCLYRMRVLKNNYSYSFWNTAYNLKELGLDFWWQLWTWHCSSSSCVGSAAEGREGCGHQVKAFPLFLMCASAEVGFCHRNEVTFLYSLWSSGLRLCFFFFVDLPAWVLVNLACLLCWLF